MNRFGKLASFVSLLGVVLIAMVTGSTPAQAKDSNGARIYKHRSDDLRLKFAVKGGRVQVETLAARRTCNKGRTEWVSYAVRPMKIKQGGLFGYRYHEAEGQYIHIEMKARINKGTIRGRFEDHYWYVNPANARKTECWTGESRFKPRLKFKAHLVR